jgi:hypothetical protein
MSFFQNPLPQDFYAPWLLSDRQYNPDFKCPRNAGRGDEFVVSYGTPTFNLSGNDSDGNSKAVLTISFALNDYRNWADLQVTISASSLAATTPQEVVTSLLANAVFTDFFTVALDQSNQSIQIRQKRPNTSMRFYIKNGRAESVLKFNKLAGVAEMPTYFTRHTIANRFTYTDCQNALILLDPVGSNEDAAVINNAVDEKGVSKGFSSGTVQLDYQLLRGKSGYFVSQKHTVDGSNRITTTIEYPTGAQAGDLAKKITYSYTSSNTNPDKKVEVPYTLTGSDLVTP